MVFEAVVTDLLNRFIGDYVENLDKSQLKLGIWGGNVVLDNLQIKENALSDLGVPFKVKAGQIDKLSLKIPWKNLYNEAVVATLDGLYLVIVPGASIQYDVENEERQVQEAKQKELLRIEEALQKTAEKDKPKEEKKDTFLEKLATQVIKNLQISIKHIHLRYEDDITDRGKPISMGVTLGELSLLTTDEKWKTCILNEAAKIIYKLVRLDSLCAYWNVKSSLYYNNSREQILLKLKQEIAISTHEPKGHQYIFKPVSASAKLQIDPYAEIALQSPKVILNVEVRSIAFEMTKPQYLSMIDLLESVDYMVRNIPYRKYRPCVPPHTHAKEWWNYAINSILEVHIRKYNRMWCWSYIKKHRLNLKTYRNAYKTKLRSSKITEDILKEIKALEKSLDVFNITLARQQAQAEVIRSGQKLLGKKHSQAEKQGGGWFSGFWGKKDVKMKEEESSVSEAFENLLTAEEKKKLYTAIGYSESSCNMNLPKQYVASVVTFNLESTSVAVREEQNVPEILKIQMIDLSTNVSQRPGAQALKVEAKLKHWHVTGLQQNGIVPSLVASVGDATSSLLTIHFETNPEGSPVDQVLNVQSQPVEIIYDAKTVNGITEFFQSSKGMDLEQLTSATLMKLEEIREKTAAGLTHIIETRKILDLSIDLKPSYLIIPQTGFYHRSSNLLIVDFGRLQLSSTNCDGKQLSPPSFSSLQELMDRAYESYELELKRVQVLFSKSGEDWKAVRLQQVSSQHVLQPVDIKLHVAKSMVEKDARMANFKVSGELPLLHIKMSEQKIIGILQLVDSIPLPETSPASPTISKRKVTTVPVVSVKSENLFEHILDRHFLLTDDDTESEESCNADENSQITCSETVDEDALEELEEPRTSASEELTVLQVNFEIKEVTLELLRQGNRESRVLVLTVTQLGTQATIRTYDMTAVSYLGKISLDYHELKDAENQPLHLITSADNTGSHLLKVEYIKADKNGPNFISDFDKTEQMIKVSFSSLDLLLHTEALLSTVQFITAVIPPKNPSSSEKERDEKDSAWKSKGSRLKKALKLSNDSEIFDFKLFAKMDAFAITVCDKKNNIADIRIQGLDSSVFLQARQTEVFARLQDITITDIDSKTVHKKAVSIVSDEVFSFRVLLYPGATEGDAYRDMSKVDGKVVLRVGCIQVVYLHKFLKSLLMFLDNFQMAKEAVSTVTVHAAEKAASSVKDFAQKSFRLAMDIHLEAPVFVVPESPVSQNAFVADLGLITIQNTFMLAMANDSLVPPVIDKMQLQLNHMRLYRTILQSGPSQCDIQMLKPINMQLSVERNLAATWFYSIPAIAIKGELQTMDVVLSQEDLNVLQKILTNNFGGVPNELQEEKQPKYSEEKKETAQEVPKYATVLNALPATENISEDNTAVQLYFKIKEVVMTLTKPVKHEHSPCFVLSISDIGTETIIKSYDMHSKSHLKKISMTCFEFTDSQGGPLQIVSSSESNTDLLTIEYLKADRNGPDFKTAFGNTEQTLNVAFASLDLLLHMQALLAFINFFTPALPTRSLSADPKQDESKAKAGEQDRQVATKAVTAVNEDDAFSLKLVSKLGAFNVLVCDEKSIIADIKIQGMNASVSIQSKQTEVFARLQNIVVMDTDAQVLHKKAVSIIGDEVFSFKMLLYPFATEGEAYNDMSNVDGEVMLRVGCIQIVYLHKFLMSLLSFLDNFQTAKEALGAASRQAAEKAASSMMDLAQKSFRLSMDIYLKAPVIVVPESSISQNAIVADLGLITLKNQFSLVVAENCALPPVIDRLDMQLTQLKLSRTVIQLDKSCQPVQAMLQPVNLLLSIHRNLAFAWYHKIPAIEISGDLKPMEIAVSQSDVTLLMKILLENLGEGAKVKEREKTQEAQVSKRKEEKGEVDTLNDSIEVLLSEKSVVEAENPGSNSETFRFAFHFESLSIVLLLDDCQQSSLQSTHLKRPTLGKLNLHLMTASGKIFQDGTLDVNTKLKGCTLDDLREGIEIACSRMIDKKTAPDDHVIIDITYKQEKKENLITAILEKLYVCASMEFLMTVADFFLKAMPQSLEASTSKSAQFKQVSSIKSSSYSADTQQQKMTVKALVIDPEVVFVANLMRSDAPALAVSFQCDFFLSLGEESKMIFAVLRDLKVLACPFLREKRENSVTTVLQPCSLTLEARISSGEQNIVIRIPDLVVKISPIILNTVMTIVTAVAPKQVEAETPILTEETGNLWASKNIMECNYWFLGTDKAIEVKETYRSIERRTGLEALVLEVDSVQVTMDCGQGHRTVPVLLAESSLNVKAKDWTSLLSVDALMSLEVHYYNEMHAVWEPLVERLEDGTRRWNLNLEIRNNPAQDTVPGDDFYVFPEPKTSISISSKDTMNVTITKCSLDVFSNLAKAFSEGAAATYDYSVKDKAPYTVRNALGIPLKMQFSSILRVRNSTVSERVHTLDEGEVLELEYSALEPLHRGRLSALQRQESSLFGLTVAPQGYSEVANIPVVKPGRRLYSVRSLTLSNQVSVMAQIDAAEGNKIIVIRSSLQIKNHFTIPFIVYKLVLSLRLMEPIGVLRPGEEFHVPLEAYRCQLFLRPTGVLESQYKESSSHITWKEMVHRSTEIKSIVHCPSTEVGSPPLIVSTVAVPDQITFVASSREEEWEPAYIINLYPTLTLKNLLPYPLRYLVEGTAETHELAEGCMADILHARIDGELMELVLVKYQGRNWNGHLKVHNGLPEFFLVCFTADSVEKLTVDLSVHVKWVNGRMFLSVFSPYWIINQTSRILQYRAEDVHVKHPADFRDIVLFSFKKKNIFSKNKVQLCISTSGWSNSFSLDAVGSYGCVKCPANNMEFLVGVTVKISSFSLTKIITMTPFFTLANKSSYEIEVSEILANGAVPNERWHYVPAAECLPFWPETTSGKMCVRVVGFDRPSKPFFYNRQDNGTLLTLDNLCGGIVVNVDIPQHCVVISFSDYCDGAAPALLINHTPEAIIYYCQSGIQDTLELLPSKVHRFAWIDPAGTRKLTWKCEQNSGELELLKDECGQFPFNQATQIHWVSFLDGRQRVLLFTEDVALVSRARQAEEMEQPNIGIDVSLHKLGLSLVNNDNKQEIAYIGINSSDVIWEYRPKQRWKPFQEKNITLLENAYKKHLNNAEDPGWIKLENNFEIYFDKIPMEMRKPFRYHIRRNFQSGIQVEFKQSTHQRYLRAQMYWLQIDNQLPGAMFPVVFHPIAPPKSIALDSEPKPFIDISIITRINEHSQIMQFKYFMMLIQEMALKVDQGFLEAVIAFFTLKSYPQTKERNTLIEQDMKALNAELMESSMKDISGLSFFEQLHISPIKLHLSLSLGSGGDDADKEKQEMAAMQSVNLLLKSIGATLTDVDDLIFKLGFFQVEYQFYRQDQLMWIAVRHYSEQFLKQMYVLVLGLDVLGNPFGLIRGLSEGVEAFFYEPFQGAVQGPEEFAEGFVIGVRSLLGHTVGGAAGVVSRITGSVGKGLAAITMDKEFQQKRREEMNRQPKDFGDSLARGGKGLLRGVVGGVTGIITKPVEGAKREGAAGFFKGIGKGLVGVVARPTGGIIDMASSTFQGIQRVAESTEEVAKLRSPRVIKEDGIIRPYCQREAEGCEMFEKSDITKLEGELYHAHCDVQGSKKTKLLITNRRVMCVKQLEIIGHLNREWSYSLDDFTLSPSVEGASLKLYVLDQGLFQKKNSSRPEVVKNVQLADISTAKLMCNAIEDALTARQTQKLLKKKSTQFITKPSTAL